MKTYEIFKERKAPTPDHVSFTARYTAYPDPKREGLYKMSVYHSIDGYKRKFSYLYGERNQAKIQKWIKTMRAMP